ncbi:MAG: hypothetical protein HY344_02445 [Candidatus Levybacteria bacterium]|nr:hypothetical protein [Candidatus Levybacteria bacterium]
MRGLGVDKADVARLLRVMGDPEARARRAAEEGTIEMDEVFEPGRAQDYVFSFVNEDGGNQRTVPASRTLLMGIEDLREVGRCGTRVARKVQQGSGIVYDAVHEATQAAKSLAEIRVAGGGNGAKVLPRK